MTDALGVLMLLENNPYPNDLRVRNEAVALTEAGHRVSVIAPRGRGQRWREVVDGVQVYRYPMPPPVESALGYLWEYGFSLVSMLFLSLVVKFRRGFDVIHAHNPPDVLVLVALPYRLLGTRFVFDHHDLSPEMYSDRFGDEASPMLLRALSWFERLTFRVADRVISTNESYRAVAIDRGGHDAATVRIVRNGPDLERLRIMDPIPDVRARASTVIGYVGEMGPQDGLDHLLRSAAILVNDLGRTDVCFMLIGDGDAHSALQALTVDLDLTRHVWFTGRIDDPIELSRLLSSADICVDPDPKTAYNDRSTMIKMMEYMTFAKPIVAFDLTEHRTSAGDAAVYVPDNDERAFAHALASLIDDPDRRAELGALGRQRVESQLTWEYSIPPLLETYRSLVGHRRRRRGA